MITTIEIVLPNPTNQFIIKAPHDSFFVTNPKQGEPFCYAPFEQDAQKLNEMLDDLPIGTVRALFNILQKDHRINKELKG